LSALAPQRRGPKVHAGRADSLRIAQLTRERDNLQSQLDKAQLVIEVQKELPRCLVFAQPTTSARPFDGCRY